MTRTGCSSLWALTCELRGCASRTKWLRVPTPRRRAQISASCLNSKVYNTENSRGRRRCQRWRNKGRDGDRVGLTERCQGIYPRFSCMGRVPVWEVRLRA
jgi:hypothetical protein